MKRIGKFVALSTLSAVLCTGATFAQDDHHDDHHDNNGNAARQDDHHDNQGYVHHDEWKKGYHMKQEDWSRAQPVDYRTYHLKTPRRGYEWRQVDGNYVLGAVATGIIVSAIVASSIH